MYNTKPWPYITHTQMCHFLNQIQGAGAQHAIQVSEIHFLFCRVTKKYAESCYHSKIHSVGVTWSGAAILLCYTGETTSLLWLTGDTTSLLWLSSWLPSPLNRLIYWYTALLGSRRFFGVGSTLFQVSWWHLRVFESSSAILASGSPHTTKKSHRSIWNLPCTNPMCNYATFYMENMHNPLHCVV